MELFDLHTLMKEGFEKINKHFEKIEDRFGKIEDRLSKVEQDVSWIKGKLEGKSEMRTISFSIFSMIVAVVAILVAIFKNG
ncbi:MAG: hypothetical protein OXU23_00710 [Candidatus Poribacteria bacterium]|nr:hypothetical protein [Candidatus Poribacteria bacterium]